MKQIHYSLLSIMLLCAVSSCHSTGMNETNPNIQTRKLINEFENPVQLCFHLGIENYGLSLAGGEEYSYKQSTSRLTAAGTKAGEEPSDSLSGNHQTGDRGTPEWKTDTMDVKLIEYDGKKTEPSIIDADSLNIKTSGGQTVMLYNSSKYGATKRFPTYMSKISDKEIILVINQAMIDKAVGSDK